MAKSKIKNEETPQKEHEKPWRETYATVEEIKDYLRNHIYLRFNTVKHQVEARLPSAGL